jgi:hypothetical protein
MDCIKPIPDFVTKLPTCPAGYHYDPATQLCCPDSNAPFDYQDPTIRATVTGWADHTFDPNKAYKVGMQGVKASGVIEAWIVGFLRAGIRLLGPLIQEAASLFDDFLTILGEVFLQAQGQGSRGYYELAAGMVTDLLGISSSGASLYHAFTTGGRQAAMKELGGNIFDVLASEFADIAQTSSGGEYEIPKGTGVGNLPDVTLSPARGVAGAKAFLGYAAGFSIREGNTDMLAALIPHDVGKLFKDFAEDFAKNLGIGRIARLVWKPLVTGLVVTPMEWAMREQYRPTVYSVGEAYRAWASGVYSTEELQSELARLGWSDKRQEGLRWQHLKTPDRATLRTLHATAGISDEDYAMWEGRDGRTPEVTALLDAHDDFSVARTAVLHAASHYASEYLLGHITRTQFSGAVNSIKHTVNARAILTDGEITALDSLPVITGLAPRRHLSVAMLMRQYEDGLLTLGEFEAAVLAMGFGPDDARLLVQELLISAKRAADRNARAIANAHRGKLAKLSLAKLETAFVDGLIDLSEVRAELTARQYASAAIETIVSEFLIKAKLQQSTPPNTA